MPLDHGILNTPLASRGNIDNQIDKHLANLKALAKSNAKAQAEKTKLDRISANDALQNITVDQLAKLITASKMTKAQTLKKLKSMAYFEPARLLKIIELTVEKSS